MVLIQLSVMNIAATATAIASVANQPSHFNRRVTTKRPMTSVRVALMGTEITH